MSYRGLPPILSLVEFEPLPHLSRNEPANSNSVNTQDQLHFKQRVEQLAHDYLSGKPLFILSATLRGPFHTSWRNPWASAPSLETDVRQQRYSRRLNENQSRKRRARRLRPSPHRPAVEFPIHADDENVAQEPSRIPLPAPLSTNDTIDITEKLVNVHENPRFLIGPARFTPVNHRTISETPCQDKDPLARVVFDSEIHRVSDNIDNTVVQSTEQISHQPRSIKDQIVQHAMRDMADVLREISDPPVQSCSECGTLSTTQWRRGPHGPGTLCNACGQRYWRRKKKEVASKSSKTSAEIFKDPANSTTTPVDQQNSPEHEARSATTKISFQPTNVPNANPPLTNRPHGIQFLSQPDYIRHDISSPGNFAKRPSSFPQTVASSKLNHRQVMESLFPGGMLEDAFRRHGQLIDLMRDDAAARLSDILRLDTHLPQPKSATSTDPVKRTRPNRKARAMTFDTPVITKASKKVQNRNLGAIDLSHGENYSDMILELPVEQVPKHSHPFHKEASTNSRSIVADSADLLSRNAITPAQSKRSSTSRIVPDSPFISTQAAILDAHLAFQQGLESPQKPTASEPGVPRSALQDKTNALANINPTRNISETKPRFATTNLTENSVPPVDTQALFDAPFSFSLNSSSLASHPPGPRSGSQSQNKRASFAPEPLFFNNQVESPFSTAPTPLSRTGGLDSLRKSALKKSSVTRGANSLGSSTESDNLHYDRTPTRPSSIFAQPIDRVDHDETEDPTDMDVDSFVQDANSLLRAWSSQ